jgi:outer membrane protein OmpA-like peptidoglycan-associated protein
MSTKLVRRLLQQTSELDHGIQEVDKNAEKRKKRKLKKLGVHEEPADEQEVVDWHIRSMLRLDQAIVSKSSNGKESLQRIEREQQTENKRRKKVSGEVVGNSRSSSQQMKRTHEPTFDKKKDKKEKEEKRLKEIARLLKKGSKKKMTPW